MQIIFERLADEVQFPTPATEYSAGRDLLAHLPNGKLITIYDVFNSKRDVAVMDNGVLLERGDRACLPLGFKAQVEPGYEAQIRSRSGLALKQGLSVANAPGTIDADYPGEWMVILENCSAVAQWVFSGARIAQVVFARHATPEAVPGAVGVVTDRVGGFGSTGSSQ